ncbi:DnaA/Hda family protein [uncultured Roseobacter sp.]|uniref:DnaA ATPase domain-containing protein n=1 Tax=uncultured Roseobacter sp. TaxID=114847 RepID=UPI002625977C|nr:DnaA/Hda family protein [uncultured Roseobacter sp.]
MAEQLGFDLPGVPALGRADFLVAPSNAVAIAMIEGWRDWTGRKLLLSGPEGAGKTHLTQVWAGLSGARVISAADLESAPVPELARGHVAVEDVHSITGKSDAQTALFHLHNLVLAEGNSLLLTGQGAPAHWGIDLPDLASRLTGTPTAQLDAPDDALLAAVLAKLFADRQLTPRPELITYLLRRIDRSFASARDIVAALDAASLAQKRGVSRSLAATILDKGGPSG